MCFGEVFRFQFLGNSRKGENIIVLVFYFVGSKLFVSLADKIIPAVKGKHICCEQRLAVVGGYACFEAVVGCLHIAVSVIDTDR